MSNPPQAETTTVEQIMNDEGNEDVCMCVFVTRREEKKKRNEKKTRKEDFGGVYTVRESHINIFLITFFF